MKQVKVFIASSAELDEDKKQFDLYFSEKNKLYRRQNIDFVQKTWKDFPSHLAEIRLQDRYNNYIKECDIFIALFHTSIGKYTLEELNVAFSQFKKSGKKPKIYIYVKKDGNEEDFLEQLKRFSEEEYGHFCDIYTDYQSLFSHFDKQLQLLEDEGTISPEIIDVKKAVRQVLLWLIPSLLAASIVVGYMLTSVRTIRIQIKETPKTDLPFERGMVKLQGKEQSRVSNIKSLSEDVIFTDISTWNYLFSKFQINIDATGFESVDTILSVSECNEIPIKRDNTYGCITGYVVDIDGKGIENAKVAVSEVITMSDNDGHFEVNVPIEKQRVTYKLRITKQGYAVYEINDIPPSSSDNMRLQMIPE